MATQVLVDIGFGASGKNALPFLVSSKEISLSAVTFAGEQPTDLPPGVPVGEGTVIPLLKPRTCANAPAGNGNSKAWDLINRCALEAKGSLEIITLGALTNIAIALARYPEMAESVKRIIVLGGSTENGDITAFAEKNIYHDPCAADIVFKSHIPILMCGLQVTAKVAAENPDMVEMVPAAAVLSDCFYTVNHCFTGIERNSPKTEGMTVCDFFGRSNNPANADVMVSLDVSEFSKLIGGKTGKGTC